MHDHYQRNMHGTPHEEEGARDGAAEGARVRFAGRRPRTVHDARDHSGGHPLRSLPPRGHRRTEGPRPGMRYRDALHRELAPLCGDGRRVRQVGQGPRRCRRECGVVRRRHIVHGIRCERRLRRRRHRGHEPSFRMPERPCRPSLPGEGAFAVRVRVLHPHGGHPRFRQILRGETRKKRGLAPHIRVRHPPYVRLPHEVQAHRGDRRCQDRPTRDSVDDRFSIASATNAPFRVSSTVFP